MYDIAPLTPSAPTWQMIQMYNEGAICWGVIIGRKGEIFGS